MKVWDEELVFIFCVFCESCFEMLILTYDFGVKPENYNVVYFNLFV